MSNEESKDSTVMLNILLAIVFFASIVITASIFTALFDENKRKKEIIKQIRARGPIVRKIERS